MENSLEEEYAVVVEGLKSKGVWIPEFLSREKSVDIICSAIRDRKRFNLVRLGDGEIGGFIKNARSAKWRERNRSNRSNKGETYEEVRAMACEIIEDAIRGADAIGLLSLFDRVRGIRASTNASNVIVRDFSNRSVAVWRVHWLLSKNYFKSHRIDVNKKIFVDHNLTRVPELGDAHQFSKIVSGRKVVIMSPHASFFLENGLSDILKTDVGYVDVPWRMKKGSRNVTMDEDISPIVEEIKKHQPDVVVFEGGTKMKNIGNFLNCVCLDFGATLDAWAGMRTRPPFREGNSQEYCVLDLTSDTNGGKSV